MDARSAAGWHFLGGGDGEIGRWRLDDQMGVFSKVGLGVWRKVALKTSLFFFFSQ